MAELKRSADSIGHAPGLDEWHARQDIADAEYALRHADAPDGTPPGSAPSKTPASFAAPRRPPPCTFAVTRL